MSKNISHVSHVKSKKKINGKPQLPSASVLVEGEIAVNYAENVETLSIKNESGTVVTFSSDNYYTEQKLGSGFTGANSANTVTKVIEDNERAIASSLNDLDNRKLDASEMSNYYTKDETSGKTEISTALGGKVNSATFTAHTASTVHMTATEKTNLDSLATNIAAISGISSVNVTNWNTAYTNNHTHSNKATLDAITASAQAINSLTGSVGTMAFQNASSYSSATQVNTALGNKADTATTIAGYGITDAKIENQTITLGSNSVTVSSATQVNTALGNKANSTDLNVYADSVKYNSTSKYVEFYHGGTGGTKVFEYDASPFLIDGMVSNVEIKNVTSGSSTVTCLVVSFNTDAGKQDINIPISNIFDANNYYTKSETSGKTEISTALSGKANTATTIAGYGITDAKIASQTITLGSNSVTVSSATQVNTALSGKADTGHTHDDRYYTETEINTKLGSGFTGANSANTVTKVIEDNERITSAALTDLSNNKANTATTIAGYGITDAKIASQTITLGSNSVTVSSATQVNTALNDKVSNVAYDTTNKKLTKTIGSTTSDIVTASDIVRDGNGLNGVKITYSELKALRDGSQLVPSQWYRITDYTTTTVQTNTQSAGHVFDVIVRADDVNVINENAYAALHSGDTYFSTASAKLEAWELKYCIDNDTNRFAWADSTNGKGVIWWMKDENGNECPYDFKNIMFKFGSAISQSGIIANVFYYTFSVATGTNDATVTDHSLNGTKCYGNKMGVYINLNKKKLNSNVFRNTLATSSCFSNTFGNSCYDNTFGYECNYNTFGNSCYDNTFGNECNYNTFGNDCQGNTFGNDCQGNTFGNSCIANTFGNSCYDNTFGNDCQGNTFGNDCQGNTFGNSCIANTFVNNCNYNTFGNDCHDNTFGYDCFYNTFGNHCYNIKFGTSSTTKRYCKYIIVENGNQYIYINCSATTSLSSYFQNVKIAQGVNNTDTYKTITHATAGDTFQTVYKPTGSVEINV